jgi:VanZ family protein
MALMLSPQQILLAYFNQADKLYHLAAFAALIMPTALWRLHRIAWTIVAGLSFGLGIEIIQPHVGREGSALDFLTDALGFALGAACGWLLRRLLARN